ncbi:MAG: TrpR like protein, YerC/YecD [Candidatus Gottesmanbacteria bacterium GW2011_GWC2_39_8]|uniref:TrpR like protein, YerC/YecD n=1 Tax=Candidatus Gottesmanbacteria bacterium GW2011_GWC2_39_8 TaxID=1618450 RepID=A0A0G0Q6A5_9BACT|nr:MAG: TrpR like protein, YerC/YecD [Candidatus Gottesmanbacteria bacterium GW2011_GWC2_39_8]
MTQVSRYPLSKDIEKRVFEIFLDAVAGVQTSEEVNIFIEDLLSPTERVMLSKRLSIAFLLNKGYEQRLICQILRVSLGTVNKVNSSLKAKGEGYTRVIEKIKGKEKLEDFWGKVDEFLNDILPPKGQNWKALRINNEIDKRKRRKAF